MDPKRRQRILLAVLLVVLAIAGYRAFNTPSAVLTPSSTQTAAAARRQATAAASAPDVHLDALDEERPGPSDVHRDLFRFRPKAAAPPMQRGAGPPSTGPGGATPPPPGPPSPPTLPAIPFKFIGLVEGQSAKIAVLSDSRGVVHGREGDIIDGRFRIVHIGVESVEMEYLDGRGRQTIRLTGSGS